MSKEKIEVNIYYYTDENGKKEYDFSEMADEFEKELSKLDESVLVMVSIEDRNSYQIEDNLENNNLENNIEKQEPKNVNLEINLDGDKVYIRAGLIKAMKENKDLAELLIDAADYFQKNAQNFKYKN
jgi:hypothetical protein